MSLSNYSPTDLEYRWQPDRGLFRHQYDRDVHLLVVWSEGRPHEQAILELVHADFKILAEYEVSWTSEHLVHNFERLYSVPVAGRFDKHVTVGDGPLLLLVIEDPEPRYGYSPNVSGLVEIVNLNLARLKSAARALTGSYRVHSSNNLQEFFHDSALLLGPDEVDSLLAEQDHGSAGSPLVRREHRADLVGAGGWPDLEAVFRTLARACPYVVLRNFETLPGQVDDDDEIDVLAVGPLELAAVLNAVKESPGTKGSRYGTLVGGRTIWFDIRHVGDGYLDARWQANILRQRTWQGQIAVPRPDDHFFSLLYHAKVQKPAVKPAYVPRLEALAAEIGLALPGGSGITDDGVAARMIDGFLAARGYTVPIPVDGAVHRNHEFVARLLMTERQPTPQEIARSEISLALRRSRPAQIARRVPYLRRVYRGVRRRLRRFKVVGRP